MKNTKLKQRDIVCFEFGGQLLIGYIHAEEKITISECEFIRAETLIRYTKHITKIGTMPKEWI